MLLTYLLKANKIHKLKDILNLTFYSYYNVSLCRCVPCWLPLAVETCSCGLRHRGRHVPSH